MSLAPATSQVSEDLAALLSGAGAATLEHTGWISVNGPDRVRWLNGMVTNNIATLSPGEGCYTFVLSAQGRIQADLHAFALPESVSLRTDRSRIPLLLELLDRFLIMDEVELVDERERWSGSLIAGPRAAEILNRLGLSPASPDSANLDPLHFVDHVWRGIKVRLLHAESPLVPRFELWTAPSDATTVRAALVDSGATAVTEEAVDSLRILEGTPVYGVDIRDRDLPQETGQSQRALHFSKGCYLGQEIVERIHSRGNVHRTFSGFNLIGEMPQTPCSLYAEGDREKAVGELTSAAHISLPLEGAGQEAMIALGYIRREVLERKQPLFYAGGVAMPASLPFRSGVTFSNNHASQPVIA